MSKEEKVLYSFVKEFGVLPDRIKKLSWFMKTIHGFLQYLSSNQYYSDGLNKKVFLLSLESDELVLLLEKLRLKTDFFYSEIEKSIIKKEKPFISKEQKEEFNKELAFLESKINEIHSKALQLTSEIKEEFKKKT